AFFHRRRYQRPLREIVLADEHSIEVVGLIASMLYAFFICWTRTLDLVDAAVLIAIYCAYLFVLSKMPAMEAETIEDLERIPRTIVTARRPIRISMIAGLFLVGGAIIYFAAEPFL